MPLTDREVRSFKPTARDYKKADGQGLFLLVRPNRSKLWRFKYRYAGREKLLAFGPYPEVSLQAARAGRDDARKMLRDGIDPSAEKNARKQALIRETGGTFEVVTREWLKKESVGWSPEHAKKVTARIKRDLLPHLGNRPVTELSAPEIYSVVMRISDRGKHETARRALQNIGQIMRFATATGRAQGDPTSALRGTLPAPKPSHHSAITEPKKLGELLNAIGEYDGTLAVCVALRIAPHVFVRPGELRRVEWTEVDLEDRLWSIPAEKMKQREPHLVPLSRQVVALFEEIRQLTGRERFVFPSQKTKTRPLSDMALLTALRNLGYPKDVATVHGFRATARTLLDEELGEAPHLVEHQLAHVVRDPLGRAYNRTTHLRDRRELMQRWSDYLDRLRDGATVIPITNSVR